MKTKIIIAVILFTAVIVAWPYTPLYREYQEQRKAEAASVISQNGDIRSVYKELDLVSIDSFEDTKETTETAPQDDKFSTMNLLDKMNPYLAGAMTLIIGFFIVREIKLHKREKDKAQNENSA